MKIPILWDMETQDPDDFFTLLLLLDHPRVDLKAVTVTPGSRHQIGLVRQALKWFDRNDLPVGSTDINYPKSCVSEWHYKTYGDVPPSDDSVSAGDLLSRLCNESTTLVTGANLKNLGRAMDHPEFRLGRLVAQGGFAGEGVVPPELQMLKFKGMVTCPTFNLNGDPKSALRALSDPRILKRYFVSKNVCHRVLYTESFHSIFGSLSHKSKSIARIWQGMDRYFHKNPLGKAFHDPLAAACAIDESVGVWRPVEMFRENGKWGSKLKENSDTFVIIDYNANKFLDTLVESAL